MSLENSIALPLNRKSAYPASPAGIANLLFFTSSAPLAKEIGVHSDMLRLWLKGERRMPAARRRQLADIIERRNPPGAKSIARKLRAEADAMDREPKRRNTGVAAAWAKGEKPITPKKARMVKED